MALPASTVPSLDTVLAQVQNIAAAVKSQAGNVLVSLQGGNVNALFIFQMLDQLSGLITGLNALSGTTGLNTYATAQLPGYSGTMTNDITTTVNAAQACINWVVTNFPASGGFIQAFTLNANGTRTPASFSSTQTGGLQTLIQALIATIG
jgi:hypothetical protein